MAILSTGQNSLFSQGNANDSVRIPNPVCWHEGMLLSPQHFQQNHLYWEVQLRQQLSLSSAHYWGIAALQLDRSALLEGKVIIQRLLAIMPDGLPIDYRAGEDLPLTLELDFKNSDAHTVQLTVPIQVPGSASERSEIQRYSTTSDSPRVDENTGDNEVVLPRLQPRLSLQATDKASNRYVGLPLFRVIKPDTGHPQLDPGYAPPLLQLGADAFRIGDEAAPGSRPLPQRLQALALAVRHKALQLAGLSEGGESLGHHVTQRHHSWIRAMVKELPELELLAQSADSKPFELYRALLRMAGPISELDPSNIPPRFPPYQHDNALPGFDRVISYIQQQVERVNLNYTSIGLNEKQDGVFTLSYDKEWEGKDLLLELTPTAGGGYDSLVRWLGACRIASVSVHKELMQRRLLGASAEAIEHDEKSGISPASGHALFRLKANKTLLRPGSEIAIVCTNRKLSQQRPAGIVMHIPHE
ncbi:type VI secretion system baseplate subunit TssK [Oceanobacter mangrovi]|uniref:type VI secretion system baseplate subunit TssK n=1 Tax=Oceanobacter mangrovi TaxID=2862510 RepID=UPI001C8DDDA8|nr:type VI secretion system baseplate subunit TssK [Oceanobacter mangrovi]